MEEFDELDDMGFGSQYLEYDPEEIDGFEDVDFDDLEELPDAAEFSEFDDVSDFEDEDVSASLDLERAYRALAEHRPDLLHPSVFQDSPGVSPYQVTQSAAEMAFRAMDAREQILSSVSGFGNDARSAALSVLAGTPTEALMNPLAVDLIANFAIGEAVRQGRMASVSGPSFEAAPVAGSAGFGGLGVFESIFGSGQFSDLERTELRSAGF